MHKSFVIIHNLFISSIKYNKSNDPKKSCVNKLSKMDQINKLI